MKIFSFDFSKLITSGLGILYELDAHAKIFCQTALRQTKALLVAKARRELFALIEKWANWADRFDR